MTENFSCTSKAPKRNYGDRVRASHILSWGPVTEMTTIMVMISLIEIAIA